MITNVLQYLENAAEKYADKVAFADEKKQVTWKEALIISKNIGSYLLNNGIHDRAAAVLIDRDIESILMFFGCAYSGNFYVPIDMTMPESRVRLIFDTLKPECVLTKEKTEMSWYTVPEYCWEDMTAEAADEEALLTVRKKHLDTNPLYAIFTSGSTGVPKGVVVNHRSVIDLVEQFAVEFAFDDKEVFGNQAPFDFDVSVKDIYSTLKNGASLQVVPKRFFSMPGMLVQYLEDAGITTVIWATSALRVVENFKALESGRLQKLKKIMFSGEVMPVKVLNYWKEYLPEAMFVNLYGPTEITCNCSFYKVSRDYAEDESLPIGKAFENCEILLLNENEPTPAGEIGEICVKGTCLAMGYYGNWEKTNEVFCQNPLNDKYPEKIYRTGDLGFLNEEGNLIFSGRKDYQIKHMGHRIELGEIEVAINALDYVDAACCIYDEKKEKIFCMYQTEEKCDKKIIKDISAKLPKYMWPNRWVHFEQLPMNKNAKIDRVKLKKEVIDGNNS